VTHLPLPLLPRLDPKPWGGRKLAGFGFGLPPAGPIGEAVVTASEAIVASGPHAGRTLGEIVAADPGAALGPIGLRLTGGRPLFPLLVKFIDAAEVLSVQVHPDDAAALRQTGGPGKTEAWHVLQADPDAALFLGLRADATLSDIARLARAGEPTGHLLARHTAIAGETLLLPAGTIHAVGAGVVVYEVQQPSDTTWRLDDWGRVGLDGQPRPLHIEQALAVADDALRPQPIAPVAVASDPGRTLLVACRYFALERIALAAGATVPCQGARAQVITCLRGRVTLSTGAGACDLVAGGSAVVLAAARQVALQAGADSEVLRAWTPDLAEDIVAPARAAGTSLAAIAALAAPLSDLADAGAR
jgi:mannose-6-phosphate isomerase